jgi:hypothetical protein
MASTPKRGWIRVGGSNVEYANDIPSIKKTQKFGTNKGMPREMYFLKEKLMIN